MKQYEAVIFAVEWVLNVIPSKKRDNFEIPVIPDKKTREQLEGPSIS